jgi:hypothetical protein
MLESAGGIVHQITLWVGRLAAGIFGAIAGAIFVAVAVWFVCRMTVNKQPPRPIRRGLRVLGAIAGAIAAVLFLPIGYGGFGLGSGGLGLGPGGGGFTPAEVKTAESLSKQEAKSHEKPEGRKATSIVMLGGSLVVGEAFYRFEDDRKALTLAEVQSKLKADMQVIPPLTAIEIVIYFEDSLARQSAPVVRLVAWANQVGLKVTVVSRPGHVPP